MEQKQSSIKVTSPFPYPQIRVERKNTDYASLLMEDMASSGSEMTAIYQYIYENWIFQNEKGDFKNLILKIAEVEMHHLDILGQLITLLGGNPKCQGIPNDSCSAWNGNFIVYEKDFKKTLQLNMLGEENAFHMYHSHARIIKDKYVSEILLKLASDEQVHYHIFKKILSSL